MHSHTQHANKNVTTCLNYVYRLCLGAQSGALIALLALIYLGLTIYCKGAAAMYVRVCKTDALLSR